jgi:phosphohistidine phosphatase
MQQRRHLWLIRHAEAAPYSPSGRDFDRPLTTGGEAQARAMGLWLAAQPERPDWLVHSNAARTSRTAELLAEPLGIEHALRFAEPRLYNPTLETVLDVVQETAGDCTRLAIVCHNPAITEVALLLAGNRRVAAMVPCAVVWLSFDGQWQEVAPGTTTLQTMQTPAGLK